MTVQEISVSILAMDSEEIKDIEAILTMRKDMIKIILMIAFYCAVAMVCMWAFLMSDPNETDCTNEDWN